MDIQQICGFASAVGVIITIIVFFIPSEKIPKSTKICILIICVLLICGAIWVNTSNISSNSSLSQTPGIAISSTPSPSPTPEPTLTPALTSTPITTLTPSLTITVTPSKIPFVTPEYTDELGWDTRETKELYPMHVVVGDIEIEGKKYYDVGGTGECTIAVNFSPNTLTVYAQWGAGEYVLSYDIDYAQLQLKNIIEDEFNTEMHHSQIRLVTIDEDGQITQRFIDK